MRLISLSILSCFLLAIPAMAQQVDPEAKKLLDQITEKGKTIESATFSFSYRAQNEELDETQTGKAAVSGEKYRVKMGPNEIVSDGQFQFTVIGEDASELQINCMPQPEDDNSFMNPKALMQPDVSAFNYSLAPEETHQGKTVKVLLLQPKSDEHPYQKIELLIDAEKLEVVAARILDDSGTLYTFELKDFNTSPTLPSNHFQINEGDFEDVVDLREDC